MGTRVVHLTAGVLSWLVRWARRAGTREFRPALVGPIKKSTSWELRYFLQFKFKTSSHVDIFILKKPPSVLQTGRLQ
jgi:hypothetical protein